MKPLISTIAIIALVHRAYTHKSLTVPGIVVATITALAHAYHPWYLPLVLLIAFYLAGTRATKINKDAKAKLTMDSKGGSGGEGPRTAFQVLANSLTATVLTLMHAHQLYKRNAAYKSPDEPDPAGTMCFSWGGDILVLGIIANYAAVCADTFSSELGILSRETPRLITSLTLRKVPRGTNGGVTLVGLGAGFLGSMIMVTVGMLFLPLCTGDTMDTTAGGAGTQPWGTAQRGMLMWGLTVWGTLGSVLDSLLGGWFQRTVKDVRSGKVVEGEGGVRVLISEKGKDEEVKKGAEAEAKVLHGEGASAVEDTKKYDPKDKSRKPTFGDEKPTRIAESGWDILDNNDVNFLMAFTMSMGAMGIAAWYWGVSLASISIP